MNYEWERELIIMPTRFERVYTQIKNEIEEIEKEFDYSNDSVAFGHFMLKQILDISNEQANESVTDGFDDNGIDAVYIDDRGEKTNVHFFQFKFPQDEKHIDAGLSQEEILKLCNGYEIFIGNDDIFNSVSWNDLLKEKKELYNQINDSDLSTLHIVRYTTCNSTDNLSLFEEKINSLHNRTGNSIHLEKCFAQEISDLYEKNRLNNWPDFSIKYKKDLSPFEDENSKVCTFYISLYNLFTAFKEIKANVFDGNVRFFDEKSKVNQGILDTLRGDCSKFHLLNNGITIVCSEIINKNSVDTVNITRGSVVNGAQTVGCIMKVLNEVQDNNYDKFEKAFLCVKIIKIGNKKELIDELVYTLNTQNQMRSSYVISNDPQIKAIQKSINATTRYFLQIKNNEFNYEKATNKNFDKYVKDIIDIENSIQAVTTYNNIGNLGYLSKNNKAQLFVDENSKIIVEELTSEKIIVSYELYLKIMQITKSYRAYRKDSSKNEILKILNIKKEKEIDNYRFINTGNYVILFSLGLYCRKFGLNPESSIVEVIQFLMPMFKSKKNVSNMTKIKETFDNIESKISSMQKRVIQ